MVARRSPKPKSKVQILQLLLYEPLAQLVNAADCNSVITRSNRVRLFNMPGWQRGIAPVSKTEVCFMAGKDRYLCQALRRGRLTVWQQIANLSAEMLYEFDSHPRR